MKNTKCGLCGRLAPLGDSFRYQGMDYCLDCLKAKAEGTGIDQQDVTRYVDSSVCAKCQKDSNEGDFPEISGLRLCPACEKELLHRPFPVWIKLFFAGMAALALLGFAVNRNYFISYYHMRAGLSAVKALDLKAAASHLRSASAALPSQSELEYSADMYSGLEAIADERYAEALAFFAACRKAQGSSAVLEEYIAYADIGDAFDKRDYRRMLQASQRLRDAMPGDGMRILGVASAAACLYAVGGDAAYRADAEDLIERAAALKTPETGAQFEEYEKRIRHRLETKKIITSEEYYAIYPQDKKDGAK